MFSGIEAEKFEFADDGNLLISTYTKVELHGRTRMAFPKYFQWCAKWLLQMNIEKIMLVPFNLVESKLILHKVDSETVRISDRNPLYIT